MSRSTVSSIHRTLLSSFEWTSDKELHGVPEVWDRPILVGGMLKGDCDDFMLEGYFRCLDKGIDKSALKPCVCLTKVGKSSGFKFDHAILLYFDGEDYWGFDNRYPRLFPLKHSEYFNVYVPATSNIAGKWALLDY